MRTVVGDRCGGLYRDLPWKGLAQAMPHPLVMDSRQCLDWSRLIRSGFHYVGIVS
jgi:hypothetical protein